MVLGVLRGPTFKELDMHIHSNGGSDNCHKRGRYYSLLLIYSVEAGKLSCCCMKLKICSFLFPFIFSANINVQKSATVKSQVLSPGSFYFTSKPVFLLPYCHFYLPWLLGDDAGLNSWLSWAVAEPTRRRTQSRNEESENSEPPATPCCIPLSELLDLSGPQFSFLLNRRSLSILLALSESWRGQMN